MHLFANELIELISSHEVAGAYYCCMCTLLCFVSLSKVGVFSKAKNIALKHFA